MKYEFNKLILGKNYIEYIFNTNLSKSNLPIWKSDYWNEYNSSNLKCFKLTQSPSVDTKSYQNKINYYYKIVIDYKVSYLISSILNDIKHHLIKKSTILQISNNKCVNIIKVLAQLDYFECLIFSKNFCTSKYFELKNMHTVRYVIYKGLYNTNMNDLSSNIDILSVAIKNNTNNLFSVPNGIKKILIKNKRNKHLLHLENLKDIKNILLINHSKCIQNYSNLEFQYLAYLDNKNSFIDFTNLPNCVRILELCDNFDKTLDYLPNSIEKIIFNRTINTNLSNIPSSVKEISINKLSLNNIRSINELPEFIQILNIEFNCNFIDHNFNNNIHILEQLVNLPSKMNILNVNGIYLEKFIIKANEIKYKKNQNIITNYYVLNSSENIYNQIKKYYKNI